VKVCSTGILVAWNDEKRYPVHMKSDTGPPKARQYIENLASSGRYHFDSSEARKALGVSSPAANAALHRLAKQGVIASPAFGFYVIVPPEYRSLGCLPADQFIPALMKKKGLPYYAGLLTAAQYHGAAHQRPQEFQVVLELSRRPIVCGAVRVAFIRRARAAMVPVQGINTPRGALLVSTPEATALDLVGYESRVGGLGQVTTVLSDLAERIDAQKLADAAHTAPLPWAQRLGYLLEQVGAAERTAPLKAYVQEHATQWTALTPAAPRTQAARNSDWKLHVNAEVETEL
jgi:predicted transcriptional regulator of viral defense system